MSASHVRLEALGEPLPDCEPEPDVACRCIHCGAVLQRGTPLQLADFLEGAVPFLARHASCRSAEQRGGAK